MKKSPHHGIKPGHECSVAEKQIGVQRYRFQIPRPKDLPNDRRIVHRHRDLFDSETAVWVALSSRSERCIAFESLALQRPHELLGVFPPARSEQHRLEIDVFGKRFAAVGDHRPDIIFVVLGQPI
ncbi:hypothetical protein [Haloglomus salinum]|uniref:hypothetical protein n=1 Tax=Haloglomus salinum TaxID=2962673 RepID=UPI0020C9F2BF|nr:hypothetical protein [Haloglomus salinum]